MFEENEQQKLRCFMCQRDLMYKCLETSGVWLFCYSDSPVIFRPHTLMIMDNRLKQTEEEAVISSKDGLLDLQILGKSTFGIARFRI